MPQLNIEAKATLALQALQRNPKLTLNRAAAIYEVPRARLRRRSTGIASRADWVPKRRKLSDLEEQTTIEYVLDLDSRGFPPRLAGAEEMANRLLTEREAQPVGKHWASNFIKRHLELQMRSFRKYDYKRAQCEDPALIRQWFSLVENTMAKYDIGSNDLYNFDETGFLMGMIGSGMVVTGAERRGNPKPIQPGSREWVTVIQATNAEGWAVPPFIVVAGQYHLATWYQDHNLPGDWAISTTQNG
ncbi:transposase [Fusarium oxysporum f. sp. phaseoli]